MGLKARSSDASTTFTYENSGNNSYTTNTNANNATRRKWTNVWDKWRTIHSFLLKCSKILALNISTGCTLYAPLVCALFTFALMLLRLLFASCVQKWGTSMTSTVFVFRPIYGERCWMLSEWLRHRHSLSNQLQEANRKTYGQEKATDTKPDKIKTHRRLKICTFHLVPRIGAWIVCEKLLQW